MGEYIIYYRGKIVGGIYDELPAPKKKKQIIIYEVRMVNITPAINAKPRYPMQKTFSPILIPNGFSFGLDVIPRFS